MSDKNLSYHTYLPTLFFEYPWILVLGGALSIGDLIDSSMKQITRLYAEKTVMRNEHA